MAISAKSKILASDINTALSNKQDKLSYTPVKSVNGVNADAAGNVSVAGILPDYSAGVEITSAVSGTKKSYTVPFDCALVSPLYHSEGPDLILYHTANYTYSNANKKYVIVDSRPRAQLGDDHDTVFVLLKKGQVIYNDTTNATNAKVFLYPLI